MFLVYVLKSEILLHKLAHLSVLKIFSVYSNNLGILKHLSIPKTNFGSADGLGISLRIAFKHETQSNYNNKFSFSPQLY